MRILTSAVLPLALVCAACDVKIDEGGIREMRIGEGRAEDVWTRTYTVAAGGALDIVGQNGRIEVEGSAGPQVEVRAEREVRANTDELAKQLLEKLAIREEVSPSSVRLSAAGEEDEWAAPGFGRRARARVHYRVRVPAGLTLTLRTANGPIRLQRVDGRITANTTNGGITGENVSGSLFAETVNGAVRVDLASIAGDVRVGTTNGGVRLTIPRDARVTLDASVVNGGIDLDNAFGIEAPDGPNQRVNAPLNGGGPRLTATSVNGDVRIRAQ
jgi:hypothetical protein